MRPSDAFRLLTFAAFLGSAAKAAPVHYQVNFTFQGGIEEEMIELPTGSFSFDDSEPIGFQFSNFIVLWRGVTFDLTTYANLPQIRTETQPCWLNHNHFAHSFIEVLNDSFRCSGASEGPQWWMSVNSTNSSTMDLRIGSYGQPGSVETLGYAENLPFATLFTGYGSISISAGATAVPEPGSWQVMTVLVAASGLRWLAGRDGGRP